MCPLAPIFWRSTRGGFTSRNTNVTSDTFSASTEARAWGQSRSVCGRRSFIAVDFENTEVNPSYKFEDQVVLGGDSGGKFSS
jgi:hypothetical protein